ncbi:tripartite tricarboxylate transporter substrate binding protein [Sabulicella rubraurantiaca]|uniref:tripartite tricarboxylate transporter substrate binding protein n=1 Tax=Sabulicella rubraurantiaca TaxID=2811429 RepID=UPI001A961B27|nr:tripartite tricarboxylate transporter substrate binding protein [Sabulicella rubraurantiaca]
MMRRRHALAALPAALLAAPALAQAEWPRARPLRVVCPWPPGAANDMLARLTAARLQEKLGATAVVENRTGGAGLVGTREVLGAAPDGYTLLASAFNTAVMPLVLRNANFDPQTDLEVCARTAQAPLVMAITGSRPQRTLTEVIEAAKARPRDWSIAITSIGAASHLATIELNRRTGANLEMVAYRGTQPALQDLMAGNAHLLIDPSFNLLPHAGTGRIRILGIASRERSPLAPNVPTMAEAGLPGYEFQSWYGVWAPKGTPREIVSRVNELMIETMRDPAVIQRLTQQVLEPVTESIAETRRFIAAEISRAAELLQSVNYQPE